MQLLQPLPLDFFYRWKKQQQQQTQTDPVLKGNLFYIFCAYFDEKMGVSARVGVLSVGRQSWVVGGCCNSNSFFETKSRHIEKYMHDIKLKLTGYARTINFLLKCRETGESLMFRTFVAKF